MNTVPVQYRSIKATYPEAILLFRTGDFYEAFGEDAKMLTKVTGVSLEKSAESDEVKHSASLPSHALDAALRKLVKEGYKVAICEELKGAKNEKESSKKAFKQRVI